MPQNIYSKVKEDAILLTINKFEEINNSRVDICSEDRYLQISTKKLLKSTSFKAHKHNVLYRNIDTTHECWIVLKGCILAKFYDLDDSLLLETKLEYGDCAVVYNAGHSFEVIEDDTILYEVKNGPYYGQLKDKTFIEDKNE